MVNHARAFHPQIISFRHCLYQVCQRSLSLEGLAFDGFQQLRRPSSMSVDLVFATLVLYHERLGNLLLAVALALQLKLILIHLYG